MCRVNVVPEEALPLAAVDTAGVRQPPSVGRDAKRPGALIRGSVGRLADWFFRRLALWRLAQLEARDALAVQERTLLRLVRRAARTQFGREHGFDRIHSVADFQKRVPLRCYEQFWQRYWQPRFPQVGGITWPETPPYWALSSGTTSGQTKYLPVTRELLWSNRQAALSIFGAYFACEPHTRLLHGRLFFLGGSTDLENLGGGICAGDLSAIVQVETPRWLRPFVWPTTAVALLRDWEDKIRILAEESPAQPITLLAGVPSWLMVLLERVKAVTGCRHLLEIWPDLRLLVHGGVCFEPYRAWFHRELGQFGVRLVESYPSSEAFVAFEDVRYGQLRLLPDHGIFFEFVPWQELSQERPTRHTLREIERGVPYAVVVTTCAGLWAYVLGDVVRFESRQPPLLRFVGRTGYFLSAFGEHLIGEEVEKALARAAQKSGATVSDFHVGPVFAGVDATEPDSVSATELSRPRPADPGRAAPGWHRYLVECQEQIADLQQFAAWLDEELSRANADYHAHRQGDLSLGPPEVVLLRPGSFAEWLRRQGKLGGQHKVPRMDNSGQLTRQLYRFFTETGAVLQTVTSAPPRQAHSCRS